MTIVFAIDPGFKQSGYVVWDGKQILDKNIISNDSIIDMIRNPDALYWPGATSSPTLVIEQIRSYGMPIGRTTLDTIFWSGRFWEAYRGEKCLIPRLEVKKCICHHGNAKDSNIIQALVDRFAYGKRNRGKGTKKEPGFFYGFKADIWQAFALAVTFYDQTSYVYTRSRLIT